MAFRRLRFDEPVLAVLRDLPEETQDCLLEAFRQIKSGKHRLSPSSSLFRTAQACDFLIGVSVVPQDEEAEVVALLFLG